MDNSGMAGDADQQIKEIQARMHKTSVRLHRLARVTAALRTLQVLRRKQIAALQKNKPAVMYDSTTLDAIPKAAGAVAGYVGGKWPTFKELAVRWPKARRLSIAVTSAQMAECVDCEKGDVPNGLAPAWVKRQLARGLHKPVVYTSLANAQALLNTLAAAGIHRQDIRLWTAHYSYKPHICGPACGFGFRTVADATQWTDRSQGRNLDESACSKAFWL